MEITAKLNLPIDVPSSRTGKIYPIEEVENAVAEYSEKCVEGAEYGMPTGIRTVPNCGAALDKITHKTNNVWIEDGVVMATITLFNTPAGDLIKDMIAANISLKMYPAGVGTVNEDHAISDYHLIGVDIEMGGNDGDS